MATDESTYSTGGPKRGWCVEVTSLPLKQVAIVRKVPGAFGAATYRLEIHGVSVSESWIDSKERLEILAVQINAVASGYDLFGAVTPSTASPQREESDELHKLK